MTALVTLFSGRRWMLPRWGEWVRALPDGIVLVALDSSGDAGFSGELLARLCQTRLEFTYAKHPREDVRNAEDLNRVVAGLYTRAQALTPCGAERVWTVEDDVTPPPEALALLGAGLESDPKAGACGALVRCRKSRNLIAWEHVSEVPPVVSCVREVPDGVRPVAGTAFGCTLFRAQAWWGIEFRPYLGGKPAFDWRCAFDVGRAGWRWLLHGGVACRHWQSESECV